MNELLSNNNLWYGIQYIEEEEWLQEEENTQKEGVFNQKVKYKGYKSYTSVDKVCKKSKFRSGVNLKLTHLTPKIKHFCPKSGRFHSK